MGRSRRRTRFTVINPATEEAVATISLGSNSDVDRAVAAPIKDGPNGRDHFTGDGCSHLAFAKGASPAGLAHLAEIVKVLERFQFEELKGSTLMRKEPVGVCGLITHPGTGR